MPNFDEISQSTAEIKPPAVSENERPPYWNSTSGFDYDLYVVVGMSFCLPHFVGMIGGGAMISYRFFKMAAV